MGLWWPGRHPWPLTARDAPAASARSLDHGLYASSRASQHVDAQQTPGAAMRSSAAGSSNLLLLPALLPECLIVFHLYAASRSFATDPTYYSSTGVAARVLQRSAPCHREAHA